MPALPLGEGQGGLSPVAVFQQNRCFKSHSVKLIIQTPLLLYKIRRKGWLFVKYSLILRSKLGESHIIEKQNILKNIL